MTGGRGRTAGQLLEAAGCRGLQVGGARLSPKHANFVENAGEATTADILALMAEARRRVHERFGVVLEPEVQILGEVEWPAGWDCSSPAIEPQAGAAWARARIMSPVSTPAATAAGQARVPRAGSRRSPARPRSSRRPPRSDPRAAGPRRDRRGSSRFSLSSWRTRLIVVAILAGALAIAYFAWFRDSSLVAVENVKVEGVSSSGPRQIVTAALTDAAEA